MICALVTMTVTNYMQIHWVIWQVGGDFLEKALNSKDANMYTSVLFYASWCPFSNDVLQKFETLSSMFPQMTHLAVEESLVMPRYLIKAYCIW